MDWEFPGEFQGLCTSFTAQKRAKRPGQEKWGSESRLEASKLQNPVALHFIAFLFHSGTDQ